jgi:hypothetical protein
MVQCSSAALKGIFTTLAFHQNHRALARAHGPVVNILESTGHIDWARVLALLSRAARGELGPARSRTHG